MYFEECRIYLAAVTITFVRRDIGSRSAVGSYFQQTTLSSDMVSTQAQVRDCIRCSSEDDIGILVINGSACSAKPASLSNLGLEFCKNIDGAMREDIEHSHAVKS